MEHLDTPRIRFGGAQTKLLQIVLLLSGGSKARSGGGCGSRGVRRRLDRGGDLIVVVISVIEEDHGEELERVKRGTEAEDGPDIAERGVVDSEAQLLEVMSGFYQKFLARQ